MNRPKAAGAEKSNTPTAKVHQGDVSKTPVGLPLLKKLTAPKKVEEFTDQNEFLPEKVLPLCMAAGTIPLVIHGR